MKTKVMLFLFILALAGCSDEGGDGNVNSNTVADASGNVYQTVAIGAQTWLAENLKTTKYNDGTDIPLITDAGEWSADITGAYCNYENDEVMSVTCGRLYNWHAVNTGKLAPEGWRVPTDEDWAILEDYLIVNGYNYDGTTSENKIAKSVAAADGWAQSDVEGAAGNDDYTDYKNKSGFSALPAGYCGYNGNYYEILNCSRLWTSSAYDDFPDTCAWFREISYDSISTRRAGALNDYGFSVRCVKE